jgi:hypothetical protein
MAKLSPDFLQEGRLCVRAHDLEGLILWISRSQILIDLAAIRKTFSECFQAGQTDRAVRLFDAVFATADPSLDRIKVYLRLALLSFIIFGLLGGVLYLLKVVAQFLE